MLKPLWRTWYSYISSLDKNSEINFLNFGYANDDRPELDEEDEINRYPIQLYDHVGKGIKLEGQDVLEVGCGRGGGASYIARYMKPKSIVGIDRCKRAIDFCNKGYDTAGLSFSQGDAMKLGFDDMSFDAVLNIESSHSYEGMDRFLSEVHRILKPGGHLLLADFRDRTDVPRLEKVLRDSQFKLVKKEQITPQVVKALELDSGRRLDLIRRLVPTILYGPLRVFAGTEGSTTYNSFKTGKKEYWNFILRKV